MIQDSPSDPLKSQTKVLAASRLIAYGRTIHHLDGRLELISSGSYFGISFNGSQCKIHLKPGRVTYHNYVQYVLDGVYQKRVPTFGNSSRIIDLSNLGNGHHTLWVYKCTEAQSGPLFIENIEAENLNPLVQDPLPIIELIGNSITCGAASDDSEMPCGQGQYEDYHNAYYAYGPRLARALHMNFVLSSVSGYGVYRNWNSAGPTLPQVYEKTDFQDSSSRFWDFTKSIPKIVCINLGTNDMSLGDGVSPRLPFNPGTFIEKYIDFLKLVKTKYPHAQMVVLSSSMVQDSNRKTLNNALIEVVNKTNLLFPKDNPIKIFMFKPMVPRGCKGHPSVEDHKLMADELLPFFKELN